jgi:hypothetical protein
MNWRAGLFRVWVVASTIWAVTILMWQISSLFWVVHADDLLGKPWLPWWASLTSYVQPYADASLWARPGPFPVGTDLSPSNALIAARVGDILIEALSLPFLMLLAGFAVRWITAGFRKHISN